MRLALLLLVLFVTPAFAGDIRALVNDEAITDYDLQARVKLALASANLPDTPQNRQALTTQSLRQLVDEQLQLQAARQMKITVSDADVAKGVALLEEQNRMRPGQLKEVLTKQGVPPSTLERQVRASLGWGRIVNQRFGRRATVGDGDIKAMLDKLAVNQGKPEYRLLEILLPPDGETAARRLFDELMRGGNFTTLARQFSASATASTGGDMGWLLADDLEAPFNTLVPRMQPGQISAPTETPDGWRIILLAERRLIGVSGLDKATATLHQLLVPVGGNASKQAVATARARAEGLAGRITGCTSAEQLAQQENLPLSGPLGTLKVADLPANLQQAVLQTGKGKPTAPVQVGQNWAVITVCDKELPAVALPSSDTVRDQLRLRKLERLAQQYLRDLRQQAFIEIRNAT